MRPAHSGPVPNPILNTPIDLRACLAAIRPAAGAPPEAPAMNALGEFNGCMVGVIRFSEPSPWERHPDGDEWLQILDGAVDVRVLPDDPDGVATDATLRPGEVFVVPRGCWHRQVPRASVALLFMTAAETTEHSIADDPRLEAGSSRPHA